MIKTGLLLALAGAGLVIHRQRKSHLVEFMGLNEENETLRAEVRRLALTHKAADRKSLKLTASVVKREVIEREAEAKWKAKVDEQARLKDAAVSETKRALDEANSQRATARRWEIRYRIAKGEAVNMAGLDDQSEQVQ